MAWAAIPLACAAIWIGVGDASGAGFDPFSYLAILVYAVVLTIVHLSMNILARVARRSGAPG